MEKLKNLDKENKLLLQKYVNDNISLFDCGDKWAILIKAIIDDLDGGYDDIKISRLIYLFLTDGMGQHDFEFEMYGLDVDKNIVKKLFDITNKDLNKIDNVWDFKAWWFKQYTHGNIKVSRDQFCLDLCKVLPNADKEEIFIWYIWSAKTDNFSETFNFLVNELNLDISYLK